MTGGAGFIGSNLVEYLLKYGVKKVRTLDNYSNGFRKNLALFARQCRRWKLWRAISATRPPAPHACAKGVDIVLHQAALGSVPRSIEGPGADQRRERGRLRADADRR